MRRSLAVLVACTCALVAVATAAADANFTDPTGDGSGAPDIGEVAVVNDALGRVVFLVGLAGQELPADGELVVVIDSDQNGETGAGGFDYIFVVSGVDDTWALGRWDAATETFDFETPSESVAVFFARGHVQIGIDRAELGGTSALRFYVVASKVSGEEVVAEDSAPDGDAVWSYAMVTKRLSLVAAPVVAVPKKPLPGKLLTVGYVFARGDSVEAPEGAKATCVATVAGKRVAARPRVVDEIATCAVRLPAQPRPKATAKRTAKPKPRAIVITLTVTYRGAKVTRTYRGKVA